MLKTIHHGKATDLPPLLIAHGLFGSARNWGAIAKRLSDVRMVLTVDMRNHGESDWTKTHSYADMAQDLGEVIAAHGGRAHVLGHSMGGKAAMQLALTAPARIDHLIVADIAPVAYGHSHSNLAEAMLGMDLSGLTSRSEADERLAMSVSDPSVRAFLLQSLDLKGLRWRLNLDLLHASMPEITGWPGSKGQFDRPTLFLSGAESDYVQSDHRTGIKEQFTRAYFAKIPDAGHWLHAEQPRAFVESVRVFLGEKTQA